MIVRPALVLLILVGATVLGSAQIRRVTVSDLEDRFASGGDTTYVVNFWATWCKPCIAELPAFDQLDRKSPSPTVKVLLVSLDDPEELESLVVPFLKRKGYQAECVLLDEADPNTWIDKIDESWSGAIPATLFVAGDSGRRQFHETDFTHAELTKTLEAFMKGAR